MVLVSVKLFLNDLLQIRGTGQEVQIVQWPDQASQDSRGGHCLGRRFAREGGRQLRLGRTNRAHETAKIFETNGSMLVLEGPIVRNLAMLGVQADRSRNGAFHRNVFP